MHDLHFYPQAFDTEAKLRQEYKPSWMPRNRLQLICYGVLGCGGIFMASCAASFLLMDRMDYSWTWLVCVALDVGAVFLMTLLWRKLLSRYRAYGRARSAWQKRGVSMMKAIDEIDQGSQN